MSTLTLGKRSQRRIMPARGHTTTKRPSNAYRGARRSVESSGGWLRMALAGVAIFCLLAVIAAVSIGLVASYRYLTSHPYFGVERVSVAGTQRLAPGEVRAIAGVDAGTNTLALNMSDVESRLAANPWVHSVVVRRELPDGVHITITERRPVFWVQKDDALWYADARGMLIEPVGPGRLAVLPVLRLPGGEAPDLQGYEAAVDFMHRVEERAFFFGPDAVRWVQPRDGAGMSASVEVAGPSGPQEVLLHADAANVADTSRLAAAWQDLKQRNEAGRVVELGARQNKVWVQMRPNQANEPKRQGR